MALKKVSGPVDGLAEFKMDIYCKAQMVFLPTEVEREMET